MQIEARAMGDPTRYEIFRYVADSGGRVGVAELTALKGFNHNAIRQHLAKLVDAGLLEHAVAPSTGRGRPRLVYSVHPGADSRWGVIGPYERLSLLLSEMLRTGDSAVDVGRRAAARGRLGAGIESDPLAALAGDMAHAGFEPRTTQAGERAEVVLDTCPFATVALADPDTVCNLHLGMAYGVAERVGGITIDELVVNDPRRAGCRFLVHVDPEATDAGRN